MTVKDKIERRKFVSWDTSFSFLISILLIIFPVLSIFTLLFLDSKLDGIHYSSFPSFARYVLVKTNIKRGSLSEREKEERQEVTIRRLMFSSVCETRASSDFSSQMNFMEFLSRTCDRTSFPVSSNEQTHLHT